MTSRAHWKFLIAALITSGCQSTGSMLPWSASKDPVYSSSELAGLDAPRPLAAGVESPIASAKTARTATTAKTTKAKSNIQQVSATMPGGAGNVDDLIRRGQTMIREAGQDNPVKLQQARDVLNQALSIDGTNSSAHHSMAIVADLQQDFQAAEFHYKQALQARPQDASLLNDIGYSYLLQNRFHEATQYLNQTLQYEPQHERAHVNLALLSLKRGDRAGAQNRLAGIYSATDAQTTLARLEQDLQAAGGVPVMAVAAANAPMNTSANQNPPQFNPQGQYSPQQQFQAQHQNQNPNQQFNPSQNQYANQNPNQNGNRGQTAQANQPIHVFPPGVELYPEEPAVAGSSGYPQAADMNGQRNQAGRPAASPMPNQATQNQQYGALPGPPISQYNPNGAPLQQNQYGNPQSQNGQPMYSASPSQFPAPSGQQGLLQQMAPQQNYPQQQMAVNPAGSPSGFNAPLAGLNAGPGSLFPIEAEPAAQNSGVPMPQANQQYAMGQNGYPVMDTPTMPMQNGAMYPPANNQYLNPTTHGQQMPFQNSAGQPHQNYQNNTYPASSSQYPQQNQNYQSQGMQPSDSPQATPYLGAANNAQPLLRSQPQTQAQTQSPSPLAAYEQQLQNLDNRYNQAVQQLDGNGMPLGFGR